MLQKRWHLFVASALVALAMACASYASAYTYSTTLKNSRQTAIVTAVDAGGAAGYIEFGTTSMGAVLCTVPLNYNPAGTVSAGTMTLAGFPKSATCTGAGTIAAARIRTSAAVDVITALTVTATGGGGNITVDNPTVAVGQTLTVNHFTITHP